MDISTEQLQQQISYLLLGNQLIDWLIAVGVLIAGIFLTLIIKWLVINRLDAFAKKTSIVLDDALVSALRKTYLWILFFPLLLLASNWLDLPASVNSFLRVLATVALFLQVGIWLTIVANELTQTSRRRAMENNAAAATSLSAVSFLSKLVIWSVIFLLALDNLGIDVTALVAGLGVGGVAVALATQNILGDLFASLSIIVDKPFEIGDFIIVNEYLGTVENIGLKTTRIRSLGGEQIIFSNSDLLSSRVRNYKRMQERRVLFAFGILYQTSADQLEEIPRIVRTIIESQPLTRFDRAHFTKFGESSLDFEVVYYLQSSDYNIYMDTQQAVNLALVRKFAEQGIVFAYPSRSLYVEEPVPVRMQNGAEDSGD